MDVGMVTEQAEAQIECLQEIAYFEARGEGIDGMVAVMLVAHNRVMSDKYPNDFCEVRDQPWQFSFVHEIKERVMLDRKSRELAEELATLVFYSEDKTFMDNALYYHGDHMQPDWNFDLLEQVVHLGGHIFYRDAD